MSLPYTKQPIDFQERLSGAAKDALEGLVVEYERIKNEFSDAFSNLLHEEIHPTLLTFLDRARELGHSVHLDAATPHHPGQYPQRSYSFHVNHRPERIVFTFSGNYDHRKIFIYTDFQDSTTINVYDPDLVRLPLLEKVVWKGLGRLVSL